MFLWLEGTALEERVLAWAFYDGTGNATEDLEEDPPYPDGLAALLDGWRLVAAPTPEVRTPGATDFGGLDYQFMYERIVDAGCGSEEVADVGDGRLMSGLGSTTIRTMSESVTEVARPFDEHVLFSVSAWTASVPPDTWWIAPMVADVLEGTRSDPMDPVALSGLRTQPNLQLRDEPHWLEFFSFVSGTFDAVLATAGEHRYPAYGMRAWGVLIDSETSKKDLHYGPTRICETHNHSPAIFTSVFACELPDYPSAEDLSTVFHNPARHMICPWQPRVVLFPPMVGQLLVFPGWIEHSAPVVQPVAEGQRRVIVSTDYFPDQTNAAFDPAR